MAEIGYLAPALFKILLPPHGENADIYGFIDMQLAACYPVEKQSAAGKNWLEFGPFGINFELTELDALVLDNAFRQGALLL